ncbi:uncharacterized protein LOC144658168 [Oculina patagonica]
MDIPLWTTGTECVTVDLSDMGFQKRPYVYVTPLHMLVDRGYDAAIIWVESISSLGFDICLRELKNFDGVHSSIRVAWLALEDIPSAWIKQIPLNNIVTLPNTQPLTNARHYSFCQSFNFSKPFFAPPTLITSASHRTDPKNPDTLHPKHNGITEWIEEINTSGFMVCMKDLQPYNEHHDSVNVSYLAIGDLHPCISVTCQYYGQCQASSPAEAHCACNTNCPTFEDQICGSNGRTYQNHCFYKLDVCQTRTNITVLHNGSCYVFIMHRGRVALRLDSSDVQCRSAVFKNNTFNDFRRVHVQTTINYFNETGSFVHDAAVTWAEKISVGGFSACVLKAGRLDRKTPDKGLTFIDYIAYQGAPEGAVSGEESLVSWWDGTHCRRVDIPEEKFTEPPSIIVTAEHMNTDLKHDAATVWVEDVSTSSFRICLRELQDFDGLHENIRVNWIAYRSLPSSMQAEQHVIHFENNTLPTEENNNAFCKVISFNRTYDHVPSVLITAGHSMREGRTIPEYNSIAAWVEYITTKAYRVCMKELNTPHGYDPVTVTSLIIGK